MIQVLAFVLFVLAAVLAFVSDFTTTNISLLFIVGVIAAGLAAYCVESSWLPARRRNNP